MSDLHDRVAKALGWSKKDAQSMSMQALRELVRPVDPSLARELDYMIQSGAYIHGEPLARKKPGSRRHATAASTAPKKVAKDITAAVYAAQLYIGSAHASPIRNQQRLYNSMRRKIAAVAKRRGMDESSVHEQIVNEAQRRGGITPRPGQDV